MKLTLNDLDNLSELARISIADDEKEKMLADMQAILGYVSEINNVAGDVEKTKETPHFVKASRDTHYNITRPDVVTYETGSNTKVLMNEAPAQEDGYVKVAQVLK